MESLPRAIRNFNKQILAKAIDAVDEQSVEERSLSTLTIAVSKDLIPEIQKKVTKFRKELNMYISKAESEKPKGQVYCLATQFFRLTKRNDS